MRKKFKYALTDSVFTVRSPVDIDTLDSDIQHVRHYAPASLPDDLCQHSPMNLQPRRYSSNHPRGF